MPNDKTVTTNLSRRDEFVLRIMESILKSPQFSHRETPESLCLYSIEIANKMLSKLDGEKNVAI